MTDVRSYVASATAFGDSMFPPIPPGDDVRDARAARVDCATAKRTAEGMPWLGRILGAVLAIGATAYVARR
jgi:hypothetical protein